MLAGRVRHLLAGVRIEDRRHTDCNVDRQRHREIDADGGTLDVASVDPADEHCRLQNRMDEAVLFDGDEDGLHIPILTPKRPSLQARLFERKKNRTGTQPP